MSWIDKELRRRQKAQAKDRDGHSVQLEGEGAQTETERLTALWDRFEQAHAALPTELKLQRQTPADTAFSPDRMMFKVLLLASNHAGLGLTNDGIRYFWPKGNARRSNNFWIRYRVGKGYVLSRRVKPSWVRPATEERLLNERSVDAIIKSLVTGKRVTWRQVRKRRLWLF